MPHRSHLHGLKFAGALTDACWREPYNRHRLLRDLLAGLTVGIIAIPLAMALAIASGVAPQHGLYTAIVAGIIIALSGGSRFSVSGPTAAFVVILAPVSQQFGLGGLLMATLLSGIILIGMSFARLGRLIEYIPEAVTLGFTGGIALVIATLQLPDLLGVQLEGEIQHMPQRVNAILHAISNCHWPTLLVGLSTLLTLIFWPRLKLAVPGHLPAVLFGTAVAALLAHWHYPVATIGSRFSYLLADGSLAAGIPPYLPEWLWPWQQVGANGQPLQWDFATFQGILPAAMSMAMLGATKVASTRAVARSSREVRATTRPAARPAMITRLASTSASLSST